jgi:tetratricopeptide (TPR) repeat protein
MEREDKMGEKMVGKELKAEGKRLYEEGLYEESITKYEQAREAFLAEENEVEAAEMVNNLGVLYRLQHDWDDALAALEEARSIFVGLGDRSREAQTLGNMSAVYAGLGKREKARECLRQAADVFAELGDKERQSEVLLELGTQMWKAGDRQAGLATYESGLQMTPKPTIKQKTLRGLLRMRNRLLGQKSD